MLASILQDLLSIVSPVIVPLLLTLLAVVVGLRLVNLVARQLELRIRTVYAKEADRGARLMTLLQTGATSARAIIIVIAALTAMATVGIDIGPVLAAAGVVGIAISLGAQTLIKDFLGGLIVLLEDQYRVGDVITVGNVSGTVEKITLRRTNIRDVEGRLHVVSNGDVRTVSNNTRDWSRALIEINLAFDTDVERAVAVLNEAMARAAADPEIARDLLEQPEIFGWNLFSEWAVTVRLWAKVQPGEQWKVARVLRRYALQALRDAGIQIASRAQPNPGVENEA
ncbi:MAG: mechanosensitive ion channel family protein [Anaerolineae bacterium]|nr:mechanosensitive ion channel family protein [Anaerolineae bacterium]